MQPTPPNSPLTDFVEPPPAEIAPTVSELLAVAAERGPRTARVTRAADLIRRRGRYRWVGIYDVGPEEISVIAWSGASAPAFPSFPVSKGLNGDAVRTGKPVVVGDVLNDPRYLTTFGSTRSEIVVPVLRAGSNTVVGTIDVESEEPFAFKERDVEVLQRFADALASLWTDK
jgi:GAF domain-containing protein